MNAIDRKIITIVPFNQKDDLAAKLTLEILEDNTIRATQDGGEFSTLTNTWTAIIREACAKVDDSYLDQKDFSWMEEKYMRDSLPTFFLREKERLVGSSPRRAIYNQN